MDLAFDSNPSAAGKSKLVELYSEKPGSRSPPYGDLSQIYISHDGDGSQREGGGTKGAATRRTRSQILTILVWGRTLA